MAGSKYIFDHDYCYTTRTQIINCHTILSEHEGSRRMKTELLVQMDGLAKSDDLVFLLAASNIPWFVTHSSKLSEHSRNFIFFIIKQGARSCYASPTREENHSRFAYFRS